MIPTTLEMDKVFTEKDKKEVNDRMIQCKNCKKWTKHEDWAIYRKYKPCDWCKSINYDITSAKSIRTYRAIIDNKRKIK